MFRRRSNCNSCGSRSASSGAAALTSGARIKKLWLKKLEELLIPFEIILTHQEFLLDDQPRFVDFDLFGMLENFLYSGHYHLPKSQTNLRRWHRQMKSVCTKK